eukprot:28497-Eustigmatos_ZCMA.PRE.1
MYIGASLCLSSLCILDIRPHLGAVHEVVVPREDEREGKEGPQCGWVGLPSCHCRADQGGVRGCEGSEPLHAVLWGRTADD